MSENRTRRVVVNLYPSEEERYRAAAANEGLGGPRDFSEWIRRACEDRVHRPGDLDVQERLRALLVRAFEAEEELRKRFRDR